MAGSGQWSAEDLRRFMRPGSTTGSPYVDFEIAKARDGRRTISAPRAPFGTLVEAAVDRYGSGLSLGTAHVEYTTARVGTDAIAAMNGTVLDGSTITVS
jgi:hypothetical protein